MKSKSVKAKPYEENAAMREIAKLYSLLGALERQYGLAALEKDERAILCFITDRIAAGKDVTIVDVIAAELTSRASTYRHVGNLAKARVIVLEDIAGRSHITLSARWKGFDKAFAKVARVAFK